MLRESDNSMMAISPGIAFQPDSVAVDTKEMPIFRARAVQEKGMNVGTDPKAVENVPTISSGDHLCQCQQHPAKGVSAALRLSKEQWSLLERGLSQRFEAVSACFDEIVRENNAPDYLTGCGFIRSQMKSLLTPMMGTRRAHIPWTWFGSTDVHLGANGRLTVLDHNFSLPTGLDLFGTFNRDSVSGETVQRFFSLPSSPAEGITVVLTPGSLSSTGRGNEFLARNLNACSARASDLVVRGDGVYLRLGAEPVRVATIVRRIDDDLLDPNCLRPDSLVGLPGLIRAWKQGLVNVVSPPGISVANSRTFGKLIPRMIREFLGEEPQLPSATVQECEDPETLQHVLNNLKNYAIRTNDPLHPGRPFFGRTGMAIEFADLLHRLRSNPAAYVARPLLDESDDVGLNLRVFATSGRSIRLLPIAIGRRCQPDGGVPLSIGTNEEVIPIA